MVTAEAEIEFISSIIKGAARQVMEQTGHEINYTISAIFEVPRSCLVADRIAENPDISRVVFDTDSLTALTFGFNAEEASRFLPAYTRKHIIEHDPFTQLDQSSVGVLIADAIEKIHKVNKRMQISVCGTHCSDFVSVKYLSDLHVDQIIVDIDSVSSAIICAAKAHILTTARK